MCAVYAMCRAVDDSVDEATSSASQNLGKMRERIEAVYSYAEIESEVLQAFRYAVAKYDIPKHYFDELVEGMRMDLKKNRYDSYEELYLYCYRVAGVIGLIMLKIFGCTEPEAGKHAVSLGVAMQLTNILRDIKEDYGMGRIYLPQDEMARFGVLESHINEESVDEKFVSLMKFHIRRARECYENSIVGLRMITDARSRLVAWMMKDMYAGILHEIEKNSYDVFSQRAHVSTEKKALIALKILAGRAFL